MLVKADDQPVKVKPENPGGTTIPNQDNKVYDTRGRWDRAGRSQAGCAGLVRRRACRSCRRRWTKPRTSRMPTPTAEAAAVPPSQKAEDRVEQDAQDAGVDKSMEVAAVAPRKVRTMIVKADGTLVAREDPAPAPAQPAEDATAGMTDARAVRTASHDRYGRRSRRSADGRCQCTGRRGHAADRYGACRAEPALAPAATPSPSRRALAPAPRPGAVVGDAAEARPIAPARPSEQPVDIVGEVKPDKVAAVSTAAAAAAGRLGHADRLAADGGGGQVVLPGSRCAATASVLEGRQVNIVKAEISGKGTFWRVRVAASSRNEAVCAVRELQVGRRQLLRLEVALACISASAKPARSLAPAFAFAGPVRGDDLVAGDGRIVTMSESKAMILGCAGKELTPDEVRFYADERPWGFILFARNIGEPAQICRSGRFDARSRSAARMRRSSSTRRAAACSACVRRIAPNYPAGAAHRCALPERPGGGPARCLADVAAACLRPCPASASRPTACRCSTCRSRVPATSSARAPTARSPAERARARPGGGRRADGRRRAAGDEARARPRTRLFRLASRTADASTRRSQICARMISCRSRRSRHLPMAMTAHVVYNAIDPDRPGDDLGQGHR